MVDLMRLQDEPERGESPSTTADPDTSAAVSYTHLTLPTIM
nr:hypothetical protein [Nocardioides cavernae]